MSVQYGRAKTSPWVSRRCSKDPGDRRRRGSWHASPQSRAHRGLALRIVFQVHHIPPRSRRISRKADRQPHGRRRREGGVAHNTKISNIVCDSALFGAVFFFSVSVATRRSPVWAWLPLLTHLTLPRALPPISDLPTLLLQILPTCHAR